ncbi:MAG: hypothetical protein ABMA14_16225, partial [Hyphomonadaceae bacterium]
ALPMAARLGWRTIKAPRANRELDTLRFLLAWAVPSFLLFELLPTKLARLVGPGAVLTFAMAVEIIQIPIPDRPASVRDLFPSDFGGRGRYLAVGIAA